MVYKIRKIRLTMVLDLDLPEDNFTDFDDVDKAKELMQETFDQSNLQFEGIGVLVHAVTAPRELGLFEEQVDEKEEE